MNKVEYFNNPYNNQLVFVILSMSAQPELKKNMTKKGADRYNNNY